MDNDWKISIKIEDMFNTATISVYKRNPTGGTDILYQDAEKGIETIKHYKSGEGIPLNAYSLRLNNFLMEELATELAKKGVRPRQASHTEGKLEATENHLQDMRKLLKLT